MFVKQTIHIKKEHLLSRRTLLAGFPGAGGGVVE